MSTLVVKDLLFGRSQSLFEKALSFEVNAGAALHVIGDNGAGKSTLLKTIAGLITVIEGDIQWGQVPATDARQEHPEEWLYLGHSEGLKLGLNAVQNLHALVNLRRPIDIEECEQALVDVGLASVMYNAVMRLSAGQTRRVLLAQLLCVDCKIWLLDEPLAALDVKGREWLLSICRKYLTNKGVLLYTSHQPLFENDASHAVLDLLDYL